jgi:thiamine biosynthesis lipoprotein
MQTFRAMNTDVAVFAPAGTPAAEAALATRIAALFAAAEQRFSRFSDTSELTRLNRAIGPVAVSPALFAMLGRARAYAHATAGLVDAGIGAAVIAAGYDRSFSPGRLDRATPVVRPRRASVLELVLDDAAGTVTRPPHVTIDLGGVAKGATVDAAAALADEVAVDAGGDAALRGAGPDGAGWIVDVEDPRDPARVLATVRIRDGAVATSAPNRRRWRCGSEVAHHLIDPRTGRPAITDLAQATVLAPTAELADVLAKAAFLLGAAGARAFLAGRAGLGAILVDRAGGVAIIGAVDLVGGAGAARAAADA